MKITKKRQEWLDHIRRCEKSTLSMSAYAKRHALNLLCWRLTHLTIAGSAANPTPSCKTAILVRTDAYKSLILLRSLNPAPGTIFYSYPFLYLLVDLTVLRL